MAYGIAIYRFKATRANQNGIKASPIRFSRSFFIPLSSSLPSPVSYSFSGSPLFYTSSHRKPAKQSTRADLKRARVASCQKHKLQNICRSFHLIVIFLGAKMVFAPHKSINFEFVSSISLLSLEKEARKKKQRGLHLRSYFILHNNGKRSSLLK